MMLRKKTAKDKTVSDKITELFARQVNTEGESSDEADEEPRVEQEFDEYDLQPGARTSDIRKRNVKLLSEQSARYRGKIASRKEFEVESEEATDESDDDSEESTEDDALNAYKTKLSNSRTKPSSDSHVDESDDSDNDNDGSFNTATNEDFEKDEEMSNDEEYEVTEDDEDDDGDAEEDATTGIITETNRRAEIQKGECVQNQLRIWERCLEVRIHTQKLLNKANKLPVSAVLKTQLDENGEVSQQAVQNVGLLLNSLLELQSSLCRQYSEQRAAMKNTLKRPLPLYTPEKHMSPPIKRIAAHLDAHFQEQRTYRNAVLLKWDDRTKLLTPGAGVKKKSLVEEYDIIRKIDNALLQRSALIEKSQKPKDDMRTSTEATTVEESGEEKPVGNVDMYDDSDFYHQQLRELIEYKTNSSASASEMAQQFIELHKLRQKMKKKVDTRASKGRKIRYTVHNKLINFMAPDDKSTWTDESKDELYRSLFAA